MFNRLLGKFSQDLGIDLGTSNTLVYIKDKGIVINEPSVVAVNTRTDQVLAVGREAQKMVGKTPPYIIASKPLVAGVISDFEVAEKMLKYFIDRIHQESFTILPRPRVVIGIPLGITEVERKAVEDAVLSAGAREVYLVEAVMAGAIGARLPIKEATASLIVDVGGGITEICVISLGGIVTSKTLQIAGGELDKNIIQYSRDRFNLLLGEMVAEEAKIKIGSVMELKEPQEIKLRGRDLITGLPKEILINDAQIRESLMRSSRLIVDNIKSTLEVTPPELVADIYERGMVLMGGGSLLKGLDKLIAKATQIPVRIADDPATCVVRGTGIILDEQNLLEELVIPSAQEKEKIR